MKNIPSFDDFVNESSINEGTVNPADLALDKQLQSALTSNFKNVSYQMGGKDDKYYDYSNGYVNVSNKYQADDWSWLDAKRAKILQNCNFSTPVIKAQVTYSEVISKAEPKAPSGYIGVAGNDYINNVVRFDLSNPKKAKIAKEVKDFIKQSQKMPLNDDLIHRLIQFWKASKADYKTINTRDQGYGSAASVHITKSYDKAFVIKDLDIAFGKTKEEVEQIIKNHFFFRKDRVDFDWNQGVMIVGGKYTEVWD